MTISKKQEEEIWSVDSESLTSSSSGPVVSYSTSSPSSMSITAPIDFGPDAEKGFENMKFDDFLPGKPFEDTVPTLETIDKVCDDYPSLQIAYEKFKNVWRICYTDYCSKNPDEENY